MKVIDCPPTCTSSQTLAWNYTMPDIKMDATDLPKAIDFSPWLTNPSGLGISFVVLEKMHSITGN